MDIGEGRSLLSDKAILRAMEEGRVVIEPFERLQLSTASYDVTLGQWYYRERPPEPGSVVYNPFDEEHVRRIWSGPHEAESAQIWMERTGTQLTNIAMDDDIIWIDPGETILAHTNEFLGGRGDVTTMMKARSSLGRNFIETCKCAGWGDIGYINRWTMEITNNSRHHSIPLVVGRRVAQIVFFASDGTIDDRDYTGAGKYQTATDLEALRSIWSPDSMLPKMYLDREITSSD